MIYLVTDQLTAFDSSDYKVLNSNQFIKDFDLTGEIGVDTETEGFDPFKKRILTLQLGNFDKQYVIDVNCINQEVNLFLKNLFKNDAYLFLFQNAKFDLRFLMLKDWWPKNVYDTYLVESILYHGLNWEDHPKSLEHLAMKYCNAKLNKDIRGNIHYLGLTTEVIKYAADDVKYLSKIKESQMIKVDEDHLKNTVLIENEFVKCLSYIEMCGMQIDPIAWKSRMDQDKVVLLESLNALNEYILTHSNEFYKYIDNQLDLFSEGVSVSINWNSPTQVVNFFKDLGLNLLTRDKKTGKMKYSVDAKVLTPQIHVNPVVEIYLNYKSQEKLLGTYGQNWLDSINPLTGRIHTQFKQMLDTARLSSGGKDKKNRIEYINFLNIPQENSIRNCIVPKKDYVFIDSDYSSQEQVVLANFSKEPKLLEFYEKNLEGGDMHTFICKKLWPELEHLTVEEIKTKHKDKRHMAKIAGFSINYGGVGDTIAKNLSMPIEVGNQVYESYMKAFPQLKEYFTKQQKTALANGYILTDLVTGRRIYFKNFQKYKELLAQLTPEFWEEYKALNKPDHLRAILRELRQLQGEMERASLNYPIQSASASITKLACIFIFKEIEAREQYFKILFPNVIHDQIILEVPESESELWSQIVKNSMERAGEPFCKLVKLKAEPEVLKKWKK